MVLLVVLTNLELLHRPVSILKVELLEALDQDVIKAYSSLTTTCTRRSSCRTLSSKAEEMHRTPKKSYRVCSIVATRFRSVNSTTP